VSKGASPKKKPGYGKQTRRRAATASEEKTISRGGWVRVNASGKKPSDSGYQRGSNYRPQLRNKSRKK
jgi:hypothetical protein